MPALKIGFTGTRFGMSAQQKTQFEELLRSMDSRDELPILEFHHGDCLGADTHAHRIIRRHFPHIRIVIHPPREAIERAFSVGDDIRLPQTYLQRNHNIVDETDFLIAAPKDRTEVLRSGTWATIRYARAKGLKMAILYPE
jgi:hypothetical protein